MASVPAAAAAAVLATTPAQTRWTAPSQVLLPARMLLLALLLAMMLPLLALFVALLVAL